MLTTFRYRSLLDAPVLATRGMARRLDISQAALRELAEAGLIPCRPVRGGFLFSPGDVEQALAKLAKETDSSS
jgi:hypothetical protein